MAEFEITGKGIQIIGAGFGRTGTTTTKYALEKLGFKTYHMFELMFRVNKTLPEQAVIGEQPEHVDRWFESIVEEGYTATVDFPTCLFYKEQLMMFPDAKVILTTRNMDSWYASWKELQTLSSFLYFSAPFRYFQHMLPQFSLLLSKNTSKYNIYPCRDQPQHELSQFYQPWYLPWVSFPLDIYMDYDACTRYHQQFVEEVREFVPEEKLLELDVRDGWRPLLTFLNMTLPEEEDMAFFPRKNSRLNIQLLKLFLKIFFVGYPFLVLFTFYLLVGCCSQRKKEKAE